MNQVLIVDGSVSYGGVMTGSLTRAGYDVIVTDTIKSGKKLIAKLTPGSVIVAAMKLSDGTARVFIDWLKSKSYGLPVIAIVDNFNAIDVLHLTEDSGAVTVIQRPAIDKQLIEFVRKYAKKEKSSLHLGKQLFPNGRR